MICQRCIVRLQRVTAGGAVPGRRSFASTVRAANTASSINSAKPRGPPTETREGRPAATSTSAAQPFSAKERAPGLPVRSPAAPSLDPSGSAEEIESLPREPSSVPAGQPLDGLAFVKNRDPPVAMEDHEYPAWLWKLLDNGDKGKTGDDASAEGNVYSKSKAQRKKAMKAAKKAAGENPNARLPKVPIDHQTVDLAAGDGSIAGAFKADNVRSDLRSAMRDRRRKQIKESNYLKSMN